jgi:dihydroorotase-like cyclic amidohydrolase
VTRFDLLVKGGTCVAADWQGPADIGILGGRIVAIEDALSVGDADEVVDARGLIVFPGAVDAHYHFGIYRPMRDDVMTESRSSLVGGVTTVLSYFRTGSHYLNRSGPYHEILPEIVAATRGATSVDVGFHVAPMTREHVTEIPWLVQQGVRGFKYYMFYKGLNLAADSRDARAYTMAEEYDLGHLLEIMEAVSAVNQGSNGEPRVSVSIHCEQPELLRVFIERIRGSGRPQDLSAYSDARPPLAERVAIAEAVTLGDATGAPLNLLHLSSKDAIDAAALGRRSFPERDFRFETTLHHLALSSDSQGGLGGKVNPPIRTRADNQALWAALAAGTIDWVASDHACSAMSIKGDDLWPALPGFGGSSLLYPILISEGYHRRGLPLASVVRSVSTNPARAYGLAPQKGTLARGADGDLAIVDLEATRQVSAEALLSDQDHTPFQGMTLRGWPVVTVLRGRVVYRDGQPVGPPSGEVLVGGAPVASP